MISLCKFKELYRGATESIKDHISDVPVPQKEELLTYMRSQETDAVAGSAAYDKIDGATRIGSIAAYTDGIYSWTSELIYYVDKYNLQLPEAFITHAVGRQ